MEPIFPGRYTAQTDQSFVLFLVGMRINQLWRVDKWWPVTQAMAPMLDTLYRHPQKGFLGGYSTVFWPGVLMVQLWRSFDDLERFARSPDEPHLAAWRRFNQAVGRDGSVGVFHESFQVRAGEYESLYANMPRFGLGAVFAHVPATGQLATARQRRTLHANRTPENRTPEAALPAAERVYDDREGTYTQSHTLVGGRHDDAYHN